MAFTYSSLPLEEKWDRNFVFPMKNSEATEWRTLYYELFVISAAKLLCISVKVSINEFRTYLLFLSYLLDA